MQNNKKVISLTCMYTPYTLDTYVTFVPDGFEESTIEYLSEETGKALTYDDIEWEYNNKKLVQLLFENYIDLLRENILDDVILAITPDGEPWSPREYNFATDDGSVKFTVDYDKLLAYIDQNYDDFKKNKIQSCDGFMWLGDNDQTMLHYYLMNKSIVEYSEDTYFYDQYEMLNNVWYDIISYELK